MQRANNSRGNHMASRQQRPGKSYKELLKENSDLLQEVSKLKDLLDKERNTSPDSKITALTKELEEAKENLAKQKFLKEQFINKEKETRRELERLQKYCDGEALNSAKIANQVRTDIKQKKKKNLQADYEELQVAHILLQEKSAAEMEELIKKNKELQENLERITLSHQDISQKYQADVFTVGQRMDALERELDKKRESHANALAEFMSLAEQITTVQQHASEKESCLVREVEELKNQLELQISLNAELSDQLKAKTESDLPETNQLVEETQEQEAPCLEKVFTPETPTVEPITKPVEEQRMEQTCILESPTVETIIEPTIIEEAEDHVEEPSTEEMPTTNVQEEDAPKRPSFFKRARHLLGLRKPQRWKKRRGY